MLSFQKTNRYARVDKGKSEKDFAPLTVPELNAFLGVCILMGIVQPPHTRLYWTEDPSLGEFPVITKAFPRNRFMGILWHLHFNDNRTAAPTGNKQYDKLYKVKPSVTSLSEKFIQLYNPHRENSIDSL